MHTLRVLCCGFEGFVGLAYAYHCTSMCGSAVSHMRLAALLCSLHMPVTCTVYPAVRMCFAWMRGAAVKRCLYLLALSVVIALLHSCVGPNYRVAVFSLQSVAGQIQSRACLALILCSGVLPWCSAVLLHSSLIILPCEKRDYLVCGYIPC
jgi:hypothetical protein